MRLSLSEAMDALKASLVVAVPTETFYGLAARADDADAVAAVFRLKGRRPALPSPLLVPSRVGAAALLRSEPDSRVAGLMDKFWPGALTVVVAGVRPGMPEGVVGTDGTVGVRQDGHPLLASLLDGVGFAVTGTSANLSGTPPCRRGVEVDALFEGRAGYAGHIGDGETAGEAPSTIVRVRDGGLDVLRVGALEPGVVLAAWEASGARNDG